MIDRTIVCVKSFNRPHQLINLLKDLALEIGLGSVANDVVVFDDGSDVDMGWPKRLCETFGWSWVDSKVNHGKKLAWKFHNTMYQWLKTEFSPVLGTSILFFFDDDMRLCERFFERAVESWNSIEDSTKATLHFMVDSSREKSPCWTGFSPVNVDIPGKKQGLVRKTQWVDGSFMCPPKTMRLLGWKLRPIDKSRWSNKPSVSSGVGQQLSERLHQGGHGLFQTRQSLLAHAAIESKYNEMERRKTPLQTVRFIDGAAQLRRLMRVDKVTCSLASIPSRESHLEKVVGGLLGQGADVVQVFLNGYSSVPSFVTKMDSDRIVVCRSQIHGDRGDAGKFFWSADAEGYQLICDDDLWYPDDYIDTMIAAIERHSRRAIVGVHGVNVNELIVSYYQSRSCHHFAKEMKSDTPFHILGTGLLAYHSSTIRVSIDDFSEPNMADVWMGVAAQNEKVPMIAIARAGGWIKAMDVPSSIYDSCRGNDEKQTNAVLASSPWKIFT